MLWSNDDDTRGLLNATNISTNNEHISNNTWNAIHVQGLIIHPPPTLHSTACSTHLIASHKIQRHGHIRGKFNPITHASFCPHRQHQCRRITAQPPSSTGDERHDVHCDPHECPYYLSYTHDTHGMMLRLQGFLLHFTRILFTSSRVIIIMTLSAPFFFHNDNIIIASHTGLP